MDQASTYPKFKCSLTALLARLCRSSCSNWQDGIIFPALTVAHIFVLYFIRHAIHPVLQPFFWNKLLCRHFLIMTFLFLFQPHYSLWDPLCWLTFVSSTFTPVKAFLISSICTGNAQGSAAAANHISIKWCANSKSCSLHCFESVVLSYHYFSGLTCC